MRTGTRADKRHARAWGAGRGHGSGLTIVFHNSVLFVLTPAGLHGPWTTDSNRRYMSLHMPTGGRGDQWYCSRALPRIRSLCC